MKRIFAIAFALTTMMTPIGAVAQDDQTLADIRQELSILYVELQRLNRELSTTGAAGAPVVGATVLDRVTVMEQQLQALTAKTETLENRINRVVADGTNRVGDLEFRLCELEEGCEFNGEVGSTLGGEELVTAGVATTTEPTVELAIGERADFDRAKAAFENGEFLVAAEGFTAFVEAYPNGPLTAEAYFLRGSALEESGDVREAARSFLDSFSISPNGPMAPNALYKVGTTLNALGKTEEACQTLTEVGVRFPTAPATSDANVAKMTFGCS